MDESGKPHGPFFSSQLLSPLFHLPAGTENENEIDVWLAIKKKNLSRFSSIFLLLQSDQTDTGDRNE